jgi:hypothetical protein
MAIDLRLTSYAPGLLVPPESYLYSNAGFLVVFILNYTLTLDNAALAFFRLALVPLGFHFFYVHGYGAFETPQSQVSVGMVVVGLYGMMRVFETAVVSLFDKSPPRWVQRETGKVMDLPTTVPGRLFYALDLATSLRGNSWFSDRYWDFAPRALTTNSPTAHMSRREFLRREFWSFLRQMITIDVLDTLNKSRKWDMRMTYPITSLPIYEQFAFSLSVCTMTLLAITFTFTLFSTIAVLLGSSPACWPPMFDRPFTATSLSDFWSRRWHAIFRRCFERISSFFLLPFPPPTARSPAHYVYARKALRAVIIFFLSASLHILIMYRLDLDIRGAANAHPKKTFLDPAILKFFLSQPLGLAIEASVIVPLARALFPEDKKKQTLVTRVWTWSFMLWAGRYWSDVWVHRGLWQPEEKVVGYSLVRGSLYGQWVI